MHIDTDSLVKTYAEMETDEIVRRVESKSLTIEAHSIALSELKQRNFDIDSLPSKPSDSNETPMPSLLKGEFGLAKTYWGFLIVPSAIFRLTIMNVRPPMLWAILVLLYAVFMISALVAVWRAADKYTGLKVWRILAKTTCVISALHLVGAMMQLPDAIRAA